MSASAKTTPLLRRATIASQLLTLLPVMLLCIAGCGGNSTTGSLEITQQPADATVPLGQAATFTVAANSPAGTLTYQWSRNGAVIDGATSGTYSLPSAALADSGAKFSVSVSSGKDTIDSRTALLTIGPRSPQPADLRFQQVDGTPFSLSLAAGVHTNVGNGLQLYWTQTTGTPLYLGSGLCVAGVLYDCGWFFDTASLPGGTQLNIGYNSYEGLDSVDRDLTQLNDGRTVVTSYDLEPANDVFALAWFQGSSDGFDMKHESVALNQLPALAAQRGAQGRVITAISFNANGDADLLSFGWSSDPTTQYETRVLTATFDSVAAQAASLAAGGYIITAVGGNGVNGFLLVGTRVQGDSLPRPFLAFPPTPSSTSTYGYAMVAHLINDSDGHADNYFLYEK